MKNHDTVLCSLCFTLGAGLMAVFFLIGAAKFERKPTIAGIQMEKLCEAQGWVPEIKEKCEEWSKLND